MDDVPDDDPVRADDGESVAEPGVNAGARLAEVVPPVLGGCAASDAGVRRVSVPSPESSLSAELPPVELPPVEPLPVEPPPVEPPPVEPLPVEELPVEELPVEELDDEDSLDVDGGPDDVSPDVEAEAPARRRVGGVKFGGNTFEVRAEGRAAPLPPLP